jgi:hypothetical protein
MYNNYVGCEIYLLVREQKKNFKHFKATAKKMLGTPET